MITRKQIKSRSNITLCIPLDRRKNEPELLGGKDAEVLAILLNEETCTKSEVEEAIEWLTQLWIDKYDGERTTHYCSTSGCECGNTG
jgi:hypothetical protein